MCFSFSFPPFVLFTFSTARTMPISNLLIYKKTGGPEVCIPAKSFAAVQGFRVIGQWLLVAGERECVIETGIHVGLQTYIVIELFDA